MHARASIFCPECGLQVENPEAATDALTARSSG
jgi:hypothetical protein